MSDIVLASSIGKHISNGIVDCDVAVEDIAQERERWEAGGTQKDQAVVAAYKALEEGRQMIDIFAVLERGRGRSYLPGLALAPVKAKKLSVRAWNDGLVRYSCGRWRFEFEGEYHWERSMAIWRTGVASAPAIPPEVRSKVRKDHLLLWEPVWRSQRSKVERPVLDPALLERVSGSLYCVIATWDLSPLEAAALR